MSDNADSTVTNHDNETRNVLRLETGGKLNSQRLDCHADTALPRVCGAFKCCKIVFRWKSSSQIGFAKQPLNAVDGKNSKIACSFAAAPFVFPDLVQGDSALRGEKCRTVEMEFHRKTVARR